MAKAPLITRNVPLLAEFTVPRLFEPEDVVGMSARQVAVIEARARVNTDAKAAQQADVSVSSLSRWLKEPNFHELFVAARAVQADRLDEVLHHRALHGHATLRTDAQGQPIKMLDPVDLTPMLDDDFEPIYVVDQHPNDHLLLASVKARKPEYRDKGELALTGPGGGPVQQDVRVEYVLPEGLTMDEYRRRWAEEDARHGSAWPEGS